MIVRLSEEQRYSLESLDTHGGRDPAAGADPDARGAGAVEIRRLEQSRLIPVYADAAGSDLEEALGRRRRRSPPYQRPGLRVEIGGENEEMQRNFRDLAFAFTLALLLVYMILAMEFESLIHPFTILLSVLSLWSAPSWRSGSAGAGINAMG